MLTCFNGIVALHTSHDSSSGANSNLVLFRWTLHHPKRQSSNKRFYFCSCVLRGDKSWLFTERWCMVVCACWRSKVTVKQGASSAVWQRARPERRRRSRVRVLALISPCDCFLSFSPAPFPAPFLSIDMRLSRSFGAGNKKALCRWEAQQVRFCGCIFSSARLWHDQPLYLARWEYIGPVLSVESTCVPNIWPFRHRHPFRVVTFLYLLTQRVDWQENNHAYRGKAQV